MNNSHSDTASKYAVMRVLTGAVTVFVTAMTSYAEEAPSQRLPTVVVLSEPEKRSCTEDGVAKDSYDCLNTELAALVARQGDQQSVLRVTVSSAVPQTPTGQGLYNQTAMRIRMGNTFGRSVHPQRLPARTDTSALIR